MCIFMHMCISGLLYIMSVYIIVHYVPEKVFCMKLRAKATGERA